MTQKRESDNKTLTIASVNWSGIWGDKEANLGKMKTKILEAANIGADMIVFPELALSGYECDEAIRQNHKPCSMHVALTETIPGPSTEDIGKLAKELGVYIIFGMPEMDIKDAEIIYNSVAVLGPEGLVGKYRKLYLPGLPMFTETICFKSGSELPVLDTHYGLIGMQICADFALVPEFSRIQALKGAQIVISPSAIPAGIGRVSSIPELAARRGSDNQIYTVIANHTGKERSVSFAGHSTIAGPLPNRSINIFANASDGEEVISATVNLQSLNHIHSKRNPKKNINWKFIAREYAQLAGIQ
ncbi:carbon-nitrogen hydrolase family protein [Chloroflexota bacterium]